MGGAMTTNYFKTFLKGAPEDAIYFFFDDRDEGDTLHAFQRMLSRAEKYQDQINVRVSVWKRTMLVPSKVWEIAEGRTNANVISPARFRPVIH